MKRNFVAALALVGGIGSYFVSPAVGMVAIAIGILLIGLQYLSFIRKSKVATLVMWIGVFYSFGIIKGLTIFMVVEILMFFFEADWKSKRAVVDESMTFDPTVNPVADHRYHDPIQKKIFYPHL